MCSCSNAQAEHTTAVNLTLIVNYVKHEKTQPANYHFLIVTKAYEDIQCRFFAYMSTVLRAFQRLQFSRTVK